jgi:hypothetical protein
VYVIMVLEAVKMDVGRTFPAAYQGLIYVAYSETRKAQEPANFTLEIAAADINTLKLLGLSDLVSHAYRKAEKRHQE